jgi:hydrogenase maturation protease
MASAIVIGVGNPVMADDALGLIAARSVARQLIARQLDGQSGVAVAEVYNGGLELMEAMAGYDRAFVVDAIVAGGRPGTIYRLGIDEVATTRNSSTTHNGSLLTAMELGRLSGLQLPAEVRFWAVEAGDVTTFCEQLTAEVDAAVPVVAQEILRELFSLKPRLS